MHAIMMWFSVRILLYCFGKKSQNSCTRIIISGELRERERQTETSVKCSCFKKGALEFFTKYWGHETMTSWNDSTGSHASVWQHTLIIKKILQRLETKGALYAMF